MECAASGLINFTGVGHHIFDQAAEAPVRPLRHLFFTSTDLVCVSGLPGTLPCYQLTA
jgi:hypothetical protein